jgi:predicted ester cyclase
MGRAANAHDVQRIMELYAPDAVSISPVFGEVRGRAAIARTWEQMFQSMPDAYFSMSHTLKDEDRIAMIGTVTATDRVGWFGLPPTGKRFTYRMVVLLNLFGSQIVRDERIYDVETVRQSLEKARIEAELKLAAEVQSALLPTKMHDAPFCQGIGASIPSRQIGGDFFQFLSLPNGDCGVALADVAGKGPSAAILAAMIQGMLSVEAQIGNRQ